MTYENRAIFAVGCLRHRSNLFRPFSHKPCGLHGGTRLRIRAPDAGDAKLRRAPLAGDLAQSAAVSIGWTGLGSNPGFARAGSRGGGQTSTWLSRTMALD